MVTFDTIIPPEEAQEPTDSVDESEVKAPEFIDQHIERQTELDNTIAQAKESVAAATDDEALGLPPEQAEQLEEAREIVAEEARPADTIDVEQAAPSVDSASAQPVTTEVFTGDKKHWSELPSRPDALAQGQQPVDEQSEQSTQPMAGDQVAPTESTEQQ